MKYVTLGIAAIALFAPQLVSADVNYTTRYLEPGQTISRIPETRVFIKPGARLTEEWRFHSGNYLREQYLTLFPEKKQIVMDMMLRIYKVEPFDARGLGYSNTANVSVKKLNEENVLGFQAQHYQIDIKFDYQDASPDADRVVRREIWVVPSTTLKAYPPDVTSEMVGEKALGDKDALNKSLQGLVVRTRVSVPVKNNSQEYKIVYSEEITSLNTRKLDDSYFEIPAGYKQVSADEYSKAQMLLVERWILSDKKISDTK
jgi:hypothetical protein